MEDIKAILESKFWESIGMWCVAITLPEYEYWSDNTFNKNRNKAEKLTFEKAKKHIDFIRELKKSSEKQEVIFNN